MLQFREDDAPGYEPRGAKAMGLAYATSPIGGSHMRGDSAHFEIFGTTFSMDPLSTEGKAAPTKNVQDLSAIVDAAGLCIFFGTRMLAEKDSAIRGRIYGHPAPFLEPLENKQQ